MCRVYIYNKQSRRSIQFILFIFFFLLFFSNVPLGTTSLCYTQIYIAYNIPTSVGGGGKCVIVRFKNLFMRR